MKKPGKWGKKSVRLHRFDVIKYSAWMAQLTSNKLEVTMT